MAYDPAAGNAVNLDLGGFTTYTPPSGDVVDLALRDPLAPVVYSVSLAWHILAGGEQDVAWRVLAGGSQVIGWHDLRQESEDLAWAIQTGPEAHSIDLSWHVLRRDSQGVGWHVLTQEARDTAWHILAGDFQALRWNVNALPRIVPGHYGFTSARSRGLPDHLRREFRDGWVDPAARRAARSAVWAEPDRLRGEATSPWTVPPRAESNTEIPWGDGADHLLAGATASWADPAARRAERGLASITAATHVRDELGERWAAPPAKRELADVGWGEFDHLRAEARESYVDPARLQLPFTFPWDRTNRIQWLERWQKDAKQFLEWRREGRSGEGYDPPTGDHADLRLRCPLLDWPGYAVWLFLRLLPCPEASAARRKAWFLMNSFNVVRLPDRRQVPVLGLSLSTDYESWAWGVSLTLPDRETLDLISPAGGAPWDVEITVNGYTWTAVVEQFAERREFGKSGFTVSARSRSAYLAAPYAPARSYVEEESRTAAQLAAAEISEAGWELAWLPPDWLVPPGAWAYQGKTPIDAVAAIAGAVGARVQTDRAGDTLRVLSRYPVSPWAWGEATPDKAVSDNLVTTLGLRWQETAACNGVYVSGQNQGVLVNVKRTGTDGTPAGGMIMDPLITHVDAGRERGRVFLSNGGRRATVTLELPLLASGTEPGLLEPGQLAEVSDGVDTWRGLVTATRIDCGRPTVRQTVDLERYYL